MSPLAEAARIAAALGPWRLPRPSAAGRPAGGHARRRAGEGAEFWQFRPVLAGEPASSIDWRRSARSDQLYARERERADPGLLLLWLDPATSMAFASAGGLPEKRARGAVLLLALGLAALAGGEVVAVPGLPPAANGEALAAALLRGAAFQPGVARAGDAVIVASDFLDSDPAAFVGGGAGVLLHLLDPAERDFPFAGDLMFEEAAGTEGLRLAPAEAMRADYAAALERHRARIAGAAGAGWSVLEHVTDAPAAPVLAALAARLAPG